MDTAAGRRLLPGSTAVNIPPNHADLQTGLNLFNRGHFYDAHEALEDLWRTVVRDDPSRRHYQGLVQLAVAFHHQSTGNHVGAYSVLERALRNLGGASSSFPELDLERLQAEVEPWRRYLELANAASGRRWGAVKRDVRRSSSNVQTSAAPPLPKIMRRS